MIIGIGNDITDIRRIEKILVRFETRFIARCFTAAEQAYAEKRRNSGGHIATYAKRFAAKEAAAKALGTAIRGGVQLTDFEVINAENGRPELHIHGIAKNILARKTPKGKTAYMHLSLTDEQPYAGAFVIFEAR